MAEPLPQASTGPDRPNASADADPGAGPADAILRVRGLSKTFRGLTALTEYDLDLPAGRIHGVIGPNGAGKTTLFHVLSGFLRPTTGSIAFEDQEIAGWPSYKVARLGIARTFQNIRLFGDETALDNVIVGLQAHAPRSLIGTIFSSRGFRDGERALEERATELLELFGIAAQRDRLAHHLAYGDQRRLEIARAVASGPRILLLDEPNAGMNPVETQDLLRLIRRIRDELGITIIMVAHDIPLVMGLCDRIQVLNYGRTIAEGDPAAVRADEAVIEAYIGRARNA